ncbi:MAG: tetratricopeptide repeat protein [Bryobacteraceae bacterium]
MRTKRSICLITLLLLAVATATPQPAQLAATTDKASAYYNFAMGHLYAELAAAYNNRADYLSKAIDFYKQAMKLDPSTSFLLEELTDLYVQSNQLGTAVREAEDALRQNPDNLQARHLLGRLYTRSIGGDPPQNRINEEMLRKAIEQYTHITSKEPKDPESWVTLGRLYRVSKSSVDAQKAFQKALDLEPNNEDALTGLAFVYSDVGDTQNMVEMLRRVADKSPSLRNLSQLANAYEQMRDFANAAEVLKRAVAMNKNNPQLKRALAQDLLYADQLDEALKTYQELAEDETKDPTTFLRISEIYRQKRNFTKAREALAKAKEIDANSLEVRYDEVNLFEAEAKFDEAVKLLRGMLTETAKKSYNNQEKANRAMLLERLATLHRTAQQPARAVEALREIAELAPEAAPRVSAQIVDTYRGAKDFVRAEQEAQAARQRFPEDRVVKLTHASLMADLGKWETAALEVRQMLGGDKDREIHLALAQIYEKGKNFAEMQRSLEAAEKLSESKQEVEGISFMRGAMFEKMKKFDAAEAEFRKVLQGNPQNAGALNYLGYMLADRSVRLDEALGLIQKALALDPDNGAYLDSLGWVYYRLNKLGEAENYLRRSLERTGNDPTVHEHLGDVYFKQGRIKEAITHWQKSLREWETSSKSDHDPAEVQKVTRKLDAARVRLAREGR